jgi:hypothetical protein
MTYWLVCKCCGFKWKVHYDTVLHKEVTVMRMSDSRPLNQKRLTPAEVRMILLDQRSGVQLGKFLDVSPQSIHQVRTGKAYRDLWPELPRIVPDRQYVKYEKKVDDSKLSCKSCVHWWQGRCSLEVPEAGGAFAEDCSFYQNEDDGCND